MRLLFILLFLILSIAGYSQRSSPGIKYFIKDSASDAFIDSVKVTFTSYCLQGWRSGKIQTRTETRVVNKAFSKKMRRPCEWEIKFEKEGYIVCSNPYDQPASRKRERVVYMRKAPTVKLKQVD